MSDGIKLCGIEDVEKLRGRTKTWEPPEELDDFLMLVKKVIETSRYKDAYRRPNGPTFQELAAIVSNKSRRAYLDGSIDLEELLDTACYSALLYLKALDV